ncbi:MAG: hypothetical protein CVT81_12320 [Alphaproteobacteria bacterium HGW-Alphaproteobacteria-3]|nr:MAG: hypothetical protein CVT81_12320 [Alphaproteobacteria bacterium HGW-Alphaproteobacteria-3]
MTGVERIDRTRRALPAPRRAEEAPHAKRSEPAPRPQALPAGTAALGRPDLAATRPVAAFLAQYIDQHWSWPRSSARKEETRRQATHAYIGADMLPDLLAETLRGGRHQRKL